MRNDDRETAFDTSNRINYRWNKIRWKELVGIFTVNQYPYVSIKVLFFRILFILKFKFIHFHSLLFFIAE